MLLISLQKVIKKGRVGYYAASVAVWKVLDKKGKIRKIKDEERHRQLFLS